MTQMHKYFGDNTEMLLTFNANFSFDSFVSYTHRLWIEAETEYYSILNKILELKDFELKKILLVELRNSNIKKGQTKQNHINQIKKINTTTKETTTTTNYFNKLLKNIFSKNSNEPDNN